MKSSKINMEDVIAVVLAGGRDFGRCPLTTKMPTSLWSVEGKSVIERLVGQLSKAGVKKIVICSNGDIASLRLLFDSASYPSVEFVTEDLPLGTAGCVRQSAVICPARYYAVYRAGMIRPPEIRSLINSHIAGKSSLSVFLEPLQDSGRDYQTAGVYVLDAQAVKYIPQTGYCDLKEGLIPILWRNNITVKAIKLQANSCGYVNFSQYLDSIGTYLRTSSVSNNFIHASAEISPSVRICGPVSILSKVLIGENAVVLGPAVIESNCVIGPGAVINKSVLWSGAKIGSGSCILSSVLCRDAIVPQNAIIENKAYVATTLPLLDRCREVARHVRSTTEILYGKFESAAQGSIGSLLPQWLKAKAGSALAGFCWLFTIFAALVWMYWPEITEIWDIWMKSDEYSSGLLVPLLAAYVTWSRWSTLKNIKIEPSIWGLALIAAAQMLRLFGLIFMYASAQRLSLVLSIAGLVWFLFGTRFFKKMIPIILFLILMLPMPKSMHSRIMVPLQHWATVSAVFSLETLGYEVWREGNIIHIDNVTVAVAEACNGLRMLTAFFVISTLVVLIVERAWWEKLIILLSALPIGLFCNTIRLTGTAVAFTRIHGNFWEKAFHDFGGLAMMPLALVVIVLELWLLRNGLFVAAAQPAPKDVVVKKT